ncbi:MAG: pirin family protein, partial [Kocuria sp.]|nr:pirin family protein [Kocuria sp.]
MSNVEAQQDQVVCRAGGLPGPRCDERGRSPVEIIPSRDVPLGGPRAMTVRRTLPQRQRSLIGPWCFVD